MKYLFTAVLLSVTAITFGQGTKTTTITGKIDNLIEYLAYIKFKEESFLTNNRPFAPLLDDDGSFFIQFEMDVPKTAIFQHRDYSTLFYLEPGDSLHIAVDMKEFINTLNYSGSKAAAAHNNFIKDYNIYFGEESSSTPLPKIRLLEPQAYMKYSKSLRKRKTKYFKRSKAYKSFSPSFKRNFQYEIDYTYAEDLVEYPRLNPILNESNDALILPKKYFKFLKKIEINNNDAVGVEAYRYFLRRFINYKLRTEVDKSAFNNENLGFQEQVKIIQKYLEGGAMHYMMTETLMDAAQRGRMNYLNSEIEAFFASDPPNKYRRLVADKHQVAKGLRAGSPAPNFVLEDMEGKTVSLDDLKGKVIYLDFWATWCGPCRKEIYPAKQLKKRFEGEDVVFLYITLDTNKAKWTSFVKEKGMEGIHLFSNGAFNTPVAKEYNISAVPAYFLIDKKGNIVTSSPKRPSQPGVIQEIESVLNR